MIWRLGGRRDPLIEQLLTPPIRPPATVLVYRWRYELMIVTALLTGLATSVSWVGVGKTLAGLGALAALAVLAMLSSEVRQFAAARAWCIITPHRVRTCFAQAWIQNRAGQTPAVIGASAKPFGERVMVWCRAGTSYGDVEASSELLAAACWAAAAVVSRSGRFAQLVYIDVIRRPQWPTTTVAEPGTFAADQDMPPESWPTASAAPEVTRP